MSIPEYKTAKDFVEGLNELKALTRPGGVSRMFEILYAVVDYTEYYNARELAAKIRGQVTMYREDEVLGPDEDWTAAGAADLIDPDVDFWGDFG